MSRSTERAEWVEWKVGAITLAFLISMSGCAPVGSQRPGPTATRTQNGFVISETARVGLGVRANFERAMRAFAREDFDRSIEILVELVETSPYLASAQINLGIAYGRIGNLDAAEISLLAALEANPRHPVAHNELAMVYRRKGRFTDARESYEAALKLHPTFHFAHRNLGILCDLYLSDPACALKHYEKYIDAVPDDELASIWVADLRNQFGK
jgi:tetratricopeptide (TPR) repeat protein